LFCLPFQTGIYIVQELCTGGTLFDRLEDRPEFFSEAHCAKLVQQILSAIRYLHSLNIVHRDIKLEQLLFSSVADDSTLKLIDFGWSKHFQSGEKLHDIVGTPYTVAPWVIQGHYDEKCDMWALGVITYLLLSGEAPFGGLDGENLLEVKDNIMRARVIFEPSDVWSGVSNAAKAFIQKLLNPDPDKVPSAKVLQQDSWLLCSTRKNSTTELRANTVTALIQFKESTDIQQLLSEVISFTLLPEQIVDLRQEFEKIDSECDGEISLTALNRVLMATSKAGSMRTFNEQEIEEIFNCMKYHKSSQTIRWHEFLAACLSQANVDDRNLRLAFERLDMDHKGYAFRAITINDVAENRYLQLSSYDNLTAFSTLKTCLASLAPRSRTEISRGSG
jgi:calcium-dependent protein kinase